jgi:hypothetical protein
MLNKDQLLTALHSYLDEKGLSETTAQLDNSTKLREYGLPALAATKAILQDIHTYRPPTGGGIARTIKNKIIAVVKNVTISTMELAMIKQNKFNELTYQFIELLLEENKELKAKISELERNK